MQGHDAANEVAGLRRDPTLPHAASLLSFLVASLRPDLITNDSLKLAPDYVMVAAKMAAPASPANSSACSCTFSH